MIKELIAMTMIEYAMTFLGTPYVWGGNEPHTGWDCSGFVNEVLRAYKIIDKQDYSSQMLYEKISNFDGAKSQIKEGSVLFFGKSLDKISHVGIAINDWQYIESGGGDSRSVNKGFVRIRPINYRRDLLTSTYIKPKSPKIGLIRMVPFINKMYMTYHSQKQRCNNSKNKSYPEYGASGIKVNYGFLEFLSWALSDLKRYSMENDLDETISVGRIDHSKSYEFGNIKLESLRDNTIERNERLGISNKKLTNEDVVEIRRLSNNGWSLNRIANRFGISFQHVSRIKNKQRYAEL